MKKIRMKALYLKAVILFLLMTCGLSLQAVNLESMSEKKRNKLLLSIAKEVVLRYGR